MAETQGRNPALYADGSAAKAAAAEGGSKVDAKVIRKESQASGDAFDAEQQQHASGSNSETQSQPDTTTASETHSQPEVAPAIAGSSQVPYFDVVVIGAGIVGSSTAMTLSKAGKKVLILERFELLGHGRGSSHGGTRRIGLLELAPGPRVRRAWDAWIEMQKQYPDKKLFELTGEVIITDLIPHGLLMLPFFGLWVAARKAIGSTLPFKMDFLFTKAQVAARLPKCFKFGWNTAGIACEEAAMLHTGNILEHMQGVAKEHHAKFIANATALSINFNGEDTTVETTQGSFTCRNVVIAAGGWSGELLKGLGHKDVETNIQTWTCPNFDIKGVEGLTIEEKCPQFNFLDKGMYGFPCSKDQPNLTIRQIQKMDEGDDPNYRETNKEHIAVIQGLLENHLPSVQRKPSEVYTCRYPQLILDRRIGKQQILDIVPGSEGRVILASGMDGYGFKYGPIYGEEVLDLLEGRPPPVGLEWDRTDAENGVLNVLHAAIDKIMKLKVTSVDLALMAGLLLTCLIASTALMALFSLPTLHSFSFVAMCLFYGPGGEFYFDRPKTFKDLAVVGKIWAAHFFLVCGATPTVVGLFCGFAQSSSLSIFLVHFLNIAAIYIRFSTRLQAGQNYDRKWMGKYHAKETVALVTDGLYRYMRHPGFFAHMVQAISVAVFLVGGEKNGAIAAIALQFVVTFVIFNLSAAREETDLLAKPEMADIYRKYKFEQPKRFAFVPSFISEPDLADFGYQAVGFFQFFTHVRFIKFCDPVTLERFFRGLDKGNFLETNHAQDAWRPALSVESESHNGPHWKSLRSELRHVLQVTDWENRLEGIVKRQMAKNAAKLTFHELQLCLLRIFFELDTFQDPDTYSPTWKEDAEMILHGVAEWTRHLSGKGYGDWDAKVKVMEYLRKAVGKAPGHPLDETNLYVMSCFMQPLFVSPMINIPDVFSFAEHQLKQMPKEEAAAMIADQATTVDFLKECLRCAHPFPLVERWVDTPELGRCHIVGRYDTIGEEGPEFDIKRWKGSCPHGPREGKCPFEYMIFGHGPRGCQGRDLALALMSQMIRHLAKDLDLFCPSEGHNCSGRTNDNKCSILEEWRKVEVILKAISCTSPLMYPYRVYKRWRANGTLQANLAKKVQ